MAYEIRENYNPYRKEDYENFFTLTPNQSKKTYTIREYRGGKLSGKYRTYPMEKKEFDKFRFSTKNDIKQFLTGSEYYVVY